MSNDVSAIVTTIATVSLAILTAIYVWLTNSMLRSMRAAQDPHIDLTFEIDRNTVYFVVMNTGRSSARSVRFNVETDTKALQSRRDHSIGISQLYPIVNGLSYVPAEQRWKYEAGGWTQGFEKLEVAVVRITVTYLNDARRAFQRTVEIDPRQLLHVLYESFRDPNRDVAEAITDSSRIQRTVEQPHRLVDRRHEKLCPYCCDHIHKDAQKCPHCREWLTKAPTPQAAPCDPDPKT